MDVYQCWIRQVSALYANAGNETGANEIVAAFGEIVWLIPLIGAVELVGGLLFIIPKTRALGAILILAVITGIVLHNFTLFPTNEGRIIAVVLLLINLWVLIDNREKYKTLLS